MTLPRRSRNGYTPADRKQAILQAAIAYAVMFGYSKITINHVAKAAGVSYALVSAYFDNAETLRTAIMEEAVGRNMLTIVAEGLAHRHPAALAAPQQLRQAAAAKLAGVTI